MRYVKVFFQKIVSSKSDDHWYAYTNRPSYSASVSLNGSGSTFSVSIRDRGAQKATTVGQDITMWLSSDDVSDEECLLYRDHFGSTAYLAIDADMNIELISSSDFEALGDSDQNLVTQLVAV
tara:strand:+ start:2256 stop:2621 length:366 start_codon:yes stop_codon:yes gene_type:complete